MLQTSRVICGIVFMASSGVMAVVFRGSRVCAPALFLVMIQRRADPVDTSGTR